MSVDLKKGATVELVKTLSDDLRTRADGTKAESAGAEIRELKSQIATIEEQIEGGTGSGLTSEIKSALMGIAEHIGMWTDGNTQTYISNLYNALYAVTGISLNTNSLSFGSIGATQQLTATTTPSGGAVTWSSSDTSVATVDSTGLVTSVGYGNATITATAGSISATCSVTIAQETVTSISAVYTQSGTVYDSDSLDSLKSDLVVTATWSNQTTSTVDSADYTLNGTLADGTSTITVAYGGQTATFTVNVTTWDYEWAFTDGALTDNGWTQMYDGGTSELQEDGLLLTANPLGVTNNTLNFYNANYEGINIVAEYEFMLITSPSTAMGLIHGITNDGSEGAKFAINNSRQIAMIEGSQTVIVPNVTVSLNEWHKVMIAYTSDGVTVEYDGNQVYSSSAVATSYISKTNVAVLVGTSVKYKAIRFRRLSV